MKRVDAPSAPGEVHLPAVCAKLHHELAALHEVFKVLVPERLADELRLTFELALGDAVLGRCDDLENALLGLLVAVLGDGLLYGADKVAGGNFRVVCSVFESFELFRAVILRFGTTTILRFGTTVILQFGTIHFVPLTHPFRTVILRFGQNHFKLQNKTGFARWRLTPQIVNLFPHNGGDL